MRGLSLLLHIAVLLVVHRCNSQILTFRKCADLTPMKNFDVNKFSGKWYEVEKYAPGAGSPLDHSCIRMFYGKLQSDDSFRTVILRHSVLRGETHEYPGISRFQNEDGMANFTLDVLVSPQIVVMSETMLRDTGVFMSCPYLVLDTDYENYSINWNCTPVGIFNIVNVWVLSRRRGMPEDLQISVHRKIKSFGLALEFLKPMDLTACPPGPPISV